MAQHESKGEEEKWVRVVGGFSGAAKKKKKKSKKVKIAFVQTYIRTC